MTKYEIPIPKLGIMILVCAVIWLLSSLGTFSPLQSAGLAIGQWILAPVLKVTHSIDQGFQLLGNLQQIQVENIALKQELAATNQQLDLAKQATALNANLLSQLNLKLSYSSPASVVAVVKYEYAPIPGYIYVNAPASLGIKEGDWATKYNYVVGQVTKIIGDYAKIRLINATDSKISVKVGAEGHSGLLVGHAGIDYKIQNMDQGASVNVGDEIRLGDTNGIDTANLSLGKVLSVESQDVDPTKQLQIETPIDLGNLDFIVVVPNHV